MTRNHILFILAGVALLAILAACLFCAYRAHKDAAAALRVANDPFPDFAREATAATVKISLSDGGAQFQDVGSGVLIDRRGYLVTAKHNFDAPFYGMGATVNDSIDPFIEQVGRAVLVRPGRPTEVFRLKRVPAADLERKDVLLLKIVGPIPSDLPAATIARREEVKPVGSSVGIAGYTPAPWNQHRFSLYVTKGVVSNSADEVAGQTEKFYIMNVFSVGGESGGPVFISDTGQVVGVVKGGHEIRLDDRGLPIGLTLVPPIHEVPDLVDNDEKTSG